MKNHTALLSEMELSELLQRVNLLHVPAALGHLLKKGCPPNDAQDCIQQALITLVTKLQSGRFRWRFLKEKDPCIEAIRKQYIRRNKGTIPGLSSIGSFFIGTAYFTWRTLARQRNNEQRLLERYKHQAEQSLILLPNTDVALCSNTPKGFTQREIGLIKAWFNGQRPAEIAQKFKLPNADAAKNTTARLRNKLAKLYRSNQIRKEEVYQWVGLQ